MRSIQTATPRRELKEFVRCYALREIDCGEAGLGQADMATVDQAIGFYLDGQTFLDSPDGQSKLSSQISVFGPITPRVGVPTSTVIFLDSQSSLSLSLYGNFSKFRPVFWQTRSATAYCCARELNVARRRSFERYLLFGVMFQNYLTQSLSPDERRRGASVRS